MKYFCHVFVGPLILLSCLCGCPYLLLRYVTHFLHCRTIARFGLFYRYYFGSCSSELAGLLPLPHSRDRSTCYSKSLLDFSVIVPRFWAVFSCIQSEYRKIRTRKNSVFGHFSCSGYCQVST